MAVYTPIQLARFWSRVKPAPDFHCWEWTGAKNERGYGRWKGKFAHRVAYELVVGEIQNGLLLRHKCDNPKCCNPRHLVPGTHKDNAKDAVDRGRHLRGHMSGRSKLTEQQAKEILRNPEGLRVKDLAEKFGVAKSTVSMVRSGHRWAHLAQ